MDPDQQLRNLRDFLLVYNRMTEICFQRCSSNFNYRHLTMDEERCADNCAGKLIRTNHRLMGTYVQLMPKMVQRRMEEMESKAAAAAAAAEAGAAEPAGIVITEPPPSVQAPPATSLPPHTPLIPSASVPASPSAVTEVQLANVTHQPTAAAETGNTPTLRTTDTGPSLVAELPNPLPVGSPMDSGFAPSKPASLTEGVLVLPPAVAKPESLSAQEKSP